MKKHNSEAISCDVYNGKRHIGVLTRLPDEEHTTLFEYATGYSGPALPLLPKNKGPIKSKGLHLFFRNLVSEGWLKEAHEIVLGTYGRLICHFNTLAYFGGDCVGAIRVIPQQPLPKNIVEAFEGVGPKVAQKNNALVPGVQPKCLSREKSPGLFDMADRGGSTHIVKLRPADPDYYGILGNEFVTTEMVRALLPGDKTSETELVPFEGGEVLLIKRFDRDAKGNPIEFYDFCQLLGHEKYDGYYGDIARYIISHATGDHEDGIKTDLKDKDILFKRMLAMILVENADTHKKNFALLRDGDTFRLSPNFDIVSCARQREHSFTDRDGTGLTIRSRMALDITGHVANGQDGLKIRKLEPRHIVSLAKDMGYRVPEDAEKISALVKDVGRQAKAILAAFNGSGTKRFPALEIIANKPGLRKDFEALLSCLERRWNGTFAEVDIYLNKTCLKTTPAPALPKTPASPKVLPRPRPRS